MNLAGLGMILASLTVGSLGQRKVRYMTRDEIATERARRQMRQAQGPTRITPRPYYMRELPRKGQWCLFTGPVDIEWKPRPFVCFDSFQEALEFPANSVPSHQGVNSRGTPRDVRCVTGDPHKYRARQDRHFALPVTVCRNFTGITKGEPVPEPLAGYRRR